MNSLRALRVLYELYVLGYLCTILSLHVVDLSHHLVTVPMMKKFTFRDRKSITIAC